MNLAAAAEVMVLRTEKARVKLDTEGKENCVVLTTTPSSEPGHRPGPLSSFTN